jgi:hypothetical protein
VAKSKALIFGDLTWHRERIAPALFDPQGNV